MVSWFSACKNPVASQTMAARISVAETIIASQWGFIPCERMLFLAALILIWRVGRTRLVSLFPWIWAFNKQFPWKRGFRLYPVNEFVKDFWCDTYTTMNCLFPKYWLLCHWGSRDKCGQCDHPGQLQVSSSEFQHRADHVSPPVLWHNRKQHGVRLLAGPL